MSAPQARQGEIWDADLSPTAGHEQSGRRPCLIVSVDQVGTGPSDLAIVVPLTSKDKGNPLDLRIDPPDGGVDLPSFAMPYQVRTISRTRLLTRRGAVDRETIKAVSQRVRLLVCAN